MVPNPALALAAALFFISFSNNKSPNCKGDKISDGSFNFVSSSKNQFKNDQDLTFAFKIKSKQLHKSGHFFVLIIKTLLKIHSEIFPCLDRKCSRIEVYDIS